MDDAHHPDEVRAGAARGQAPPADEGCSDRAVMASIAVGAVLLLLPVVIWLCIAVL